MASARVPRKIRLLALLTVTFPLMAIAQVALARRLPYWKLEWSTFQPLLPFVGACTLLLLWLLVRGNRFTRAYYVLFATGWFGLSFFRALQGDNAFYGVSLLVVSTWLFVYGWLLFRAYDSPYIDSGQRWFEGAPVVLPLIRAQLETGAGRRGPYAVARLGLEGAYLIGPAPAKGKPSDPLHLELDFKGKLLRAEAVLIRDRIMNKSTDSHGIGVQFRNSDLDLRKEIADFVELLRGEGYVS